MAAAVGRRGLERRLERAQLRAAADQRGRERARPRVPRMDRRDEEALVGSRLERHRVAHEPAGGGVDGDLVRAGLLLQALGVVHRIAGRRRSTPGPALGDHLAGRHADPGAARMRAAQLGRRPHRAQRVVLVQERHSEDGHHDVAGIVVHGGAMPLQDGAHAGERLRAEPPARLGVQLLVGPVETGEQGRDGLAGRSRRGRCERAVSCRAQLEHPLRPRQVAQLMGAQVHELRAGREPVVHQLPGGLRQQRRAAIREAPQAGGPVERRAEVVAAAFVRLARVEGHAHTQVEVAVPRDGGERLA